MSVMYCGRCLFFRQVHDPLKPHSQLHGECIRHAPVIVPQLVEHLLHKIEAVEAGTKFPIVTFADGCGDFKPRES